ncbi:MAG: hypothetical protein WBM03_06200 [Steroidobacteraceae bacterium]
MTNILIRLGLGLTLACALVVLSGCVCDPVSVTAKPSKADFKITFTPERATKPTGMTITPNDGDAFLQVVQSPGPDDNKILWYSDQNFRIKFVQIDDQTQPLKPGKELGNEKKDWNDASTKNGRYEYTLNLKQGNGRTKETVGAKYIVQHVASLVDFDPVIIVGR